jgi:hypothetical protein
MAYAFEGWVSLAQDRMTCFSKQCDEFSSSIRTEIFFTSWETKKTKIVRTWTCGNKTVPEFSGMMEAVRISETSVDNYFTRQYIPEDNSEHHTRRRENLKSHMCQNFQGWWRQYAPLKRRSTIILHGSTSQKAILNIILAAARTSNLTCARIFRDDGGSTHLWNVGRQLFYTAVHPRRQFWTSYSPPWELEISHVPEFVHTNIQNSWKCITIMCNSI